MRRMIATVCAALLACAVTAGAAVAASGTGSAKARTSAVAASGLDRVSLQTSMEGDLFEVAGGKMALKKSHNKAVQKLARTLIKDHSKSYKDSAKIAKELGIDVEKSPAPSMQWELLTVAKTAGRLFDRWWSSLEVYDHKQDIQETLDEIKYGTNPDVVANAKQDLPMLKMHLHLASVALKASK